MIRILCMIMISAVQVERPSFCTLSDSAKTIIPQRFPGVGNVPVDMVVHLNCSGMRCPLSKGHQNEIGSPFLGTSKTTLYLGCPPKVRVQLNRLALSAQFHDITMIMNNVCSRRSFTSLSRSSDVLCGVQGFVREGAILKVSGKREI